MGQLSGAWQHVTHPVSLCPGSMVWVIFTGALLTVPNNDVREDSNECNYVCISVSERCDRKLPTTTLATYCSR